MTKFKIGDKVTWSDRTYAREVEGRNPDEILTVSGFDSNDSQYVHFHEFPIGAYEWRFELAEEHQLKAQDNSWYENGEIPPVNTKCIYTGVEWDVEGVIVAHVDYRGQPSAIIQCDGDWWPGEVGEFRPWYSDEEIAEQERKNVIDAISDVLIETERMSRYTDVAAHLYDAGLRFVEEE